MKKSLALALTFCALVSGIALLAPHLAKPAQRLPVVTQTFTKLPPGPLAARAQTAGSSVLPHACATALRPASVKSTGNATSTDDVRLLAERQLVVPVAGVSKKKLYDSFSDGRGTRKHEAIDIHAPRGTPVIAAGDGCVVKLFRSIAGGITVYQFDTEGNFAYYYAHLERYADTLKEGTLLKRGDVLGFVGSSGNAPAHAPHLHFAIFRLGPEKRWWKGSPVNPYEVFSFPTP